MRRTSMQVTSVWKKQRSTCPQMHLSDEHHRHPGMLEEKWCWACWCGHHTREDAAADADASDATGLPVWMGLPYFVGVWSGYYLATTTGYGDTPLAITDCLPSSSSSSTHHPPLITPRCLGVHPHTCKVSNVSLKLTLNHLYTQCHSNLMRTWIYSKTIYIYIQAKL